MMHILGMLTSSQLSGITVRELACRPRHNAKWLLLKIPLLVHAAEWSILVIPSMETTYSCVPFE